jgi:hypothetical protein
MKRSLIVPTALRSLGTAGIVGLIIAGGLSTYAVAAPKGPTKRAFTATIRGAQISSHGTSFEAVYKVVSSLDGTGAAIQDGTLAGTTLPVKGKDTWTAYLANGVSRRKETFTLRALNSNGISTITGSGKCTGGTGVHKNEKCTYTFTGTFNSTTGVSIVKAKGTDTR